VDIVSSIVSMVATVALLRFWQPPNTWRFPGERESDVPTHGPALVGAAMSAHEPAEVVAPRLQLAATTAGSAGSSALGGSMGRAVTARKGISGREAFIAWMPWLMLTIFVFLWGLPQVKDFLNGGAKDAPNFLAGYSSLKFPIPMLDKAVIRDVPIVAKPTPDAAVFTFNWLSATGTSLLLSGIVSGLLLGLSPLALAKIFWGTLMRVRISLLTIAAMLALGYSTKYAGLDSTMGLAFASTGLLFPFFSPLLGWLGVALTGSDTSSNVLFGNLQQVTATQVGISPVLAAASNSSGGVMGKMIDAQSIVVAGVATGQQGNEGEILRYVFFHSLALAALVGVLVFLQAYVFPWMIPAVAR
jgi:lactate permease